jgi:hypothetical protein
LAAYSNPQFSTWAKRAGTPLPDTRQAERQKGKRVRLKGHPHNYSLLLALAHAADEVYIYRFVPDAASMGRGRRSHTIKLAGGRQIL